MYIHMARNSAYAVISDLKKSRKQVVRPKGTQNDDQMWTEISIANTKNEITAIVYKYKTELEGKKFPVGFLQKKIDEVVKK